MSDSTPPAMPETFFAPAGRATHEELETLSRLVNESALFQAVLDAVDGYMLILNQQRQVLAMNRQVATDLGLEHPECLIGARPGELLGCVHVSEGPDGCGTSKSCTKCGAVMTIMACQMDHNIHCGECLATVRRGDHSEALELRVRATPFQIGGTEFTVLVLNDISGDKRRDALERTFFHDILNTIGGLMGWSSLLQQVDSLDPKEVAGRILLLSNRLAQEVRDQRRLNEAEKGTLAVSETDCKVADIFSALKTVFSLHDAAKDKNLEFDDPGSAGFLVDVSLLERVLTNMIKNALEAVGPGETVRASFAMEGDRPVFSVNNPGCMPGEVQLQIFQRSFSTKSKVGRGIGTYSMKLFGERYLKGEVGFRSTEEEGTTFFIRLPSVGAPQAQP